MHSYNLQTRVHLPVSPLFHDVVQCIGTPLLEIKKSKLNHPQRPVLPRSHSYCSGLPVPGQLRSI